MVIEPRRSLAAALALALAAAGGAWSQATPEARGEAAESDCYYTMDATGTPVFTQVLRWTADENALEYELVVRKAEAEGAAGGAPGGLEILRARTTEALAKLQLGVGNYSYKIITYNLLGQAEVETDWIPLSVLKAEMPAISRVSPARILMDERADRRVSIEGERLVAGCKVILVGADGSFQGSELQRKGQDSLVVVFPDEAYHDAEYDLEVLNPGGLRSVQGAALEVRDPLAAAESLSPPPGFVFGPAELRASRSIELSWTAVEGATDYRLSLRAAGATEPLVLKEGLKDTRYAIDDLTTLGRGGYSWTVVALRHGEGGALEQSGLEAVSDFSIRLPQLRKAAAKKGDNYFGQ